MPQRRIPEATVTRLPVYLQVLVDAAEAGTPTISSEALARSAGVNSAKVRKDLSFLGSHGTRGVGYDVSGLAHEISGVLGLTSERCVIIVGVGNLGRALAAYGGFDQRGFEVVALIDADPAMIGSRVAGRVVESPDDVERIVQERDVTFAVIATPAEHAQRAATMVVDAGVAAILNFAPVHLEVPSRVTVRTVDLSTELQILSFYERLAQAPELAAG